MDFKEIFIKADQQKNSLAKLVNDAKKLIENNIENKEIEVLLQDTLNSAMSGKSIDLDELNKQVTKITHGS